MVNSWTAILGWLAEHCPADRSAIMPPAHVSEIEDAEEVLGLALPEELKQWWKLANGVAGGSHVSLVPMLYSPLSVSEAIYYREACLKGLNEIYSENSPELFEEAYASASLAMAGTLPMPGGYSLWLPEWLPIASWSNELFVDLRGGPERGCIGPFERKRSATGEIFGTPMWSCVGQMLDEIAAALNGGGGIHGYTPTVQDGHLSWV